MAADTGGWHLDISFEQCDRLLAADAKPASTEYTAADFAECSGFLSKGSSSFYAASKLLPEPVRGARAAEEERPTATRLARQRTT